MKNGWSSCATAASSSGSPRMVVRRPVMVASTRSSIMMSIMVAVAVMLCVPTQSVTALKIEKFEDAINLLDKPSSNDVGDASDLLATVKWTSINHEHYLLLESTTHHVSATRTFSTFTLSTTHVPRRYPIRNTYPDVRLRADLDHIYNHFEIEEMHRSLHEAGINDKIDVDESLGGSITFCFQQLRYTDDGTVYATWRDLEWFQIERTRVYMWGVMATKDFQMVSNVFDSMTGATFTAWVSIDFEHTMRKGDVAMSYTWIAPAFENEDLDTRLPPAADAFEFAFSVPTCGVSCPMALQEFYSTVPSNERPRVLFPKAGQVDNRLEPFAKHVDIHLCSPQMFTIKLGEDDIQDLRALVEKDGHWINNSDDDWYTIADDPQGLKRNFGNMMIYKTVKSVKPSWTDVIYTEENVDDWDAMVRSIHGLLKGSRIIHLRTPHDFREREYSELRAAVQWTDVGGDVNLLMSSTSVVVPKRRAPTRFVVSANPPALPYAIKRGYRNVNLSNLTTGLLYSDLDIIETRRRLRASGFDDKVHGPFVNGFVEFKFHELRRDTMNTAYASIHDLEWFQIGRTRVHMETVRTEADYENVKSVLKSMMHTTFDSQIFISLNEPRSDEDVVLSHHKKFPEFAVQDLNTRLPSAADAFTLKTSIPECGVTGQQALLSLWQIFPSADQPAGLLRSSQMSPNDPYDHEGCRRVPLVVHFEKDDIQRMKTLTRWDSPEDSPFYSIAPEADPQQHQSNFGNMIMYKTVKSIQLDTATITKDSVDSRTWEQNVARLWDGLRGTKLCEISPIDNREREYSELRATVLWAGARGGVLLFTSVGGDIPTRPGPVRFTINDSKLSWTLPDKVEYLDRDLHWCMLAASGVPIDRRYQTFRHSSLYNKWDDRVMDGYNEVVFQFHELRFDADGAPYAKKNDLEFVQVRYQRLYMETLKTDAEVRRFFNLFPLDVMEAKLKFFKPRTNEQFVMRYTGVYPKVEKSDVQRLPLVEDAFTLKTTIPKCGLGGMSALNTLWKIFPKEVRPEDIMAYRSAGPLWVYTRYSPNCSRESLVVRFGMDDQGLLAKAAECDAAYSHDKRDRRDWGRRHDKRDRLDWGRRLLYKTVESITLGTETITKDSVDASVWTENISRLWTGLRGVNLCEIRPMRDANTAV